MTALMSDADLAELNGEVIEGDVVSSEVAVLPPDVTTKVSALSTLDGESQVRAVTVMLSASRTGLLAAIAAQDLPGIVEYKARSKAIQEISKQLQLGKDMQRDAAEFVRRAERGVGVGIRNGQEGGTIKTRSDNKATELVGDDNKHSPTDFATRHELTSTHGGIYDLTDGVTDEMFEESLKEARAEDNLSRSNVARKCQAKAAAANTPAEQSIPVEKPAPTPRPAGGPKGDPNQMLGNVDGMLRGIVTTLEFIRPEDINDDERKTLTDGITRSINLIRKKVKEIANG